MLRIHELNVHGSLEYVPIVLLMIIVSTNASIHQRGMQQKWWQGKCKSHPQLGKRLSSLSVKFLRKWAHPPIRIQVHLLHLRHLRQWEEVTLHRIWRSMVQSVGRLLVQVKWVHSVGQMSILTDCPVLEGLRSLPQAICTYYNLFDIYLCSMEWMFVILDNADYIMQNPSASIISDRLAQCYIQLTHR